MTQILAVVGALVYGLIYVTLVGVAALVLGRRASLACDLLAIGCGFLCFALQVFDGRQLPSRDLEQIKDYTTAGLSFGSWVFAVLAGALLF